MTRMGFFATFLVLSRITFGMDYLYLAGVLFCAAFAAPILIKRPHRVPVRIDIRKPHG